MSDKTPAGHLSSDLTAGVVTGIANLPDAMASAILAGVNPLFGLHAAMIGTPVGALLTSSQFMIVTTTSAIAMTVGGAVAGIDPERRTAALFLLALVVGLLEVVAGVLKLGRLTRFVSNAVTVGFLSGVSVLLVLSQLGDLTGYVSTASGRVGRALDLALHMDQTDGPTLAVGLLTLALIFVLDRTRVRRFNMLVAIFAASAVTVLFRLDGVATIGDSGPIAGGLPLPQFPEFALLPQVLAPAIAVAILTLVQSSGISKAYANPDGSYPDISRDFVGQGAANLAAGIFQGMPIGASVSSTALNVGAGATSRWSGVFAGLTITVAVLLFSRAVSLVAIPAMAALLIVIGIQSIKVALIREVWAVGRRPRAVMLVTFITTLIIPVQDAVFTGVILSALVYFFSAANEVQLRSIEFEENGAVVERNAPAHLPSHAVTILQIDGSLFYASVDVVERQLPLATGADRPVVIIRIRQHQQITSSFVALLKRYAAQVHAANGKIMLAGVQANVRAQLERTGMIGLLGADGVEVASDRHFESTRAALRAAHVWLAKSPGQAVRTPEAAPASE